MADRVPLIRIRDVAKNAGGPTPFRVRSLDVTSTDQVVLTGIERPLAELLVHLITGAAVPDEGSVTIAGKDTRTIATDTEWLGSLDRFGLVSDRAVLLDSLPVAANVALPLTLAIEPMSAETRQEVETLAREVGLQTARLDQPVNTIDALDRLRVHLARAIANGPEVLLLEEPTSPLRDPVASEEFGRALRGVAISRSIGWLALTNDDAFIKGAAGTRLRFNPATGAVERPRRWWPFGSS